MLQTLQNTKNQRVHIINLGFDASWIIESFKKTRPDKVYLIKNNLKTSKTNELNAIKAKNQINVFLKKSDISFKIIECNEDIYSLIKNIKDIIDLEKHNFIYFGISTGIRDYTAAFILCSILFKKNAKEIILYSQKDGGFTELPSFEAKLPKKEIIEALKLIDFDKGCTKKELKDNMFSKGVLSLSKLKYRSEDQTKYIKLNRSVLEPAEKEWGLIEIEGRKKGSRIYLTEEGKKWTKIF